MKNAGKKIILAALLSGVILAGCADKTAAPSESTITDSSETESTVSAVESESNSSSEVKSSVTDTDLKSDSEKISSSSSSGSKTSSSSSSNSKASSSSKPSAASKTAASSTASSKAASSASSSSKGTTTSKTSGGSSDSSSEATSSSAVKSSFSKDESSSAAESQTSSQQKAISVPPLLNADNMFSARDLEQTAYTTDAKKVELSDNKTIDITEEGVYIVSGTASNCTIKVNSDKDSKVQIVLDDVSITNDSRPAIYVVTAGKCFVTTSNTDNSLETTGSFSSDGNTTPDAVIFSKDDLVLNGTGTLNINSSKNGIASKDDLKITGGSYNITSTGTAVKANDSIRICAGSCAIRSSKDGLHSENNDDDSLGYIYISGGTFDIRAASDAIEAVSAVQIDGGSFEINSEEGIEGTYVQINEGTIVINASEDGINSAANSRFYPTPTIEFNGGTITIVMGQGDTDAVDSNGNIYVNGGVLDITAPTSSFDCTGTAEHNGGTITINGSQADSIPLS